MPSVSQLYRPRRFADVTGQDHVSKTLRAELASGSLGHAFLFSGPRGVGKTTCARILAKALGCDAPHEGEPCGVCPSCVSFQEGKAFDVIEIDAATHTGVDMIREAIIEHVRFAPAGKRKVYILDEAHMLSTASWNALLKTLEEPPAYAFFVFATTEWHKVPPTIVSRCQRFEFRRIQESAMVERLEMISRAQGWETEPEVLRLIASRSEGCLRDAETLFGQVGSLAESGKITLATAGLVIPLSSFAQALTWLELVRDARAQEASQEFLRWQDAGVSFTTLVDDILALLKRLLLASVDPLAVQALQQGAEDDRRLAGLVSTWSREELHDLALMLMERRRDLKLGMDPVFILLLAFTAAVRGAGEVSAPQPPRTSPVVAVPTSTPAPVPPPVKTSTEPVIPPPVATVSPEPMPVHTPSPSPIAAASVQAVAPAPVVVESPTPSVSTPPVETVVPAVSVASGGAVLDLSTARRSWSAFIRAVEAHNHSLPFILKISKPERIDGSVLVIRFPYAFHRDKILEDPKNRKLVTDCAREAFQVPTLSLDGIVAAEETSEQASGPQDVAGSLMQAFGGSVVESV